MYVCTWAHCKPGMCQIGKPAEEDLASWGHHASAGTVPDRVLNLVQAEHPSTISFVFTNQVASHLCCPMLKRGYYCIAVSLLRLQLCPGSWSWCACV